MNLLTVYRSRLWRRWYVACGAHIFFHAPTCEEALRVADTIARTYSKEDILRFAGQGWRIENVIEWRDRIVGWRHDDGHAHTDELAWERDT